MRRFAILLACLPTTLWADDIPLVTDVTAVTLYPSGATVIREVPFSAPAGDHQLILTDLPRNTPLAAVRVEVEGATMGTVSARNDFTLPRPPEEDAARDAAEAEVERLEKALRDGKARVAAIRLEAQAAQASVAFLKDLGRGDGVAALDVATLRSLTALIGTETLAALRTANDAERCAEAANRGLEDLQDELARARQVLDALVPEEEERAMLAVAIRSDDPVEGKMTVTYTTHQAGWQPVYDLHLARDTGDMTIERGALIYQFTGENWDEVAIALSTTRPTEQSQPSKIHPFRRFIFDPEKRLIEERMVMSMASGLENADVQEPAPMVLAEPVYDYAGASFDGLSVTYSYDKPVSVASDADHLRIALGTLELGSKVLAHAAPLYDDTAFLVASFTNDSKELILPTSEASFYLDGRFIGKHGIELIAAGAEADLAFGPIEGIRLTRAVLDRSEGDRGVISRSNELSEEVRIEVTNLTGQDWPMRVIDRVPYSEQEDLEITWSSAPRVSEVDVDDQRGILAWEFDLTAGASQTITLTHSLEWPDGWALQ